jgi:hypothetical protein
VEEDKLETVEFLLGVEEYIADTKNRIIVKLDELKSPQEKADFIILCKNSYFGKGSKY